MGNSLGDRIEEIKKDSKLKIEEFVALLGATKQSYNGWVKGKYSPNSDILIKILEKFPQYNAEWLLLGKGEKIKGKHHIYEVAESSVRYDKGMISKSELKKLLTKMIDEIDNL